jgi:hypothetical protein
MQFLACLCGEQSTMAGMAAIFKTLTKEGKKKERR